MKLHERLRQLRSERGLRLKDICDQADISVPYLSDLERGRTTPSLETLQIVAQAYHITMHELLTGVEFYGEATMASMPRGLAEMIQDPTMNAGLTPDWVRTLSRIELRGKRPQDKYDWYEIYLHLRRILN